MNRAPTSVEFRSSRSNCVTLDSSVVCAVVVSFKPSMQLLENLQQLRPQVGHVVVVDNTPEIELPEVLSRLERLEGYTVIRNKKNLGIAAALNAGIRRAIDMGCEWIVTFDQDSRIGDGFIATMLSCLQKEATDDRIGILCPRYRDAHLDIFLPTCRSRKGEILACMTSGSMLRAGTFQLVGSMEEQLFMDYVDHEYCLRLRSAGLKIAECTGAVLQHSLGRITYETLLGRRVATTNHSPRRRYYIHRNRTVLIKRYALKQPEWAFREINALVRDSIKAIVVEKDRLAKAGYMVRGFFDAIFGRMGERVPL